MSGGFSVKELSCAADGGSIYGRLCVPDGEGVFPTVIMSHGYNSSYADMTDIAEGLAAKGAVTYCYDFRGGSTRSKSSGKTTDMTIKTEQSDLFAVMDMIRGMDCVDSTRVYLYGESQGGYISALCGASVACGSERPGKTAGLMLLYPAFCIPDNWRGKAEIMPDTMDFMGMTLSRKFAEDLPERELYDVISGYSEPVLIFHGDADRLVDMSYSERAVKAFKDARLEVFPGEGHGFSPEARGRMLGLMTEFIGL